MITLLLGCTQREEITSYRVRKPELVDPTLVSTANAPAAAATEQQTLGLIVPLDDVSWFFKLTGDAQTVEPQQEAFLKFVQTIKFSSGPDSRPSWTLPTGWKELPGGGFRFATIQIPHDGKPLELAVSSAGGDLLANVNRWRQQLKLPPIAASDLKSEATKLQVDGHEATLVSLVGKGSGQMGGAPFAPFAGGSGGAMPADHPPVNGSSSVATAKSSASNDLKFEAPSEWSPGKPNAFSLAAFRVVDGDKHIEITVSTAGGDLLSNVNRWRGQLKLPPIDAAELAKAAKKIDTLGSTGDYVEIVGPEAAKRETILGVQTEAGGRTWFVKLKGDAELAEREKPRFETFVKSLKLP
ncbi:MAG TPA: hypothetical protein VGI40_01160 [Pirellulaceae bacterium]